MMHLAVQVVDFSYQLIPELLCLLLAKQVEVLSRCVVRRRLYLRLEVAVLKSLLRVLRDKYERTHHLLDLALLFLECEGVLCGRRRGRRHLTGCSLARQDVRQVHGDVVEDLKASCIVVPMSISWSLSCVRFAAVDLVGFCVNLIGQAGLQYVDVVILLMICFRVFSLDSSISLIIINLRWRCAQVLVI